jgi:hypothetical protein
VKTDDLIALLAADTTPVARHAVGRQIVGAVALGVAVAIVAMLATLGVRPDLAEAMRHLPLWTKVLWPASVACIGSAMLTRLATPGMTARRGAWLIAAALLVLWLAAIAAYAGAPLAERPAMIWGRTWRVCTVSIVAISLPIFTAAFLAVRTTAPTHLHRAGGCAGMLSGAAGAAVYAFHCPETALPFMAIWYVAAAVAMAAVGAWLGPRLLRW